MSHPASSSNPTTFFDGCRNTFADTDPLYLLPPAIVLFFLCTNYRRHPIHSAFFGIFPHLHFHHILGHKKKAADGFRFMRADVILPFNFLRRKISSFAICSSSNRSLNNVSPGIRNSLERFFRNSMLLLSIASFIFTCVPANTSAESRVS